MAAAGVRARIGAVGRVLPGRFCAALDRLLPLSPRRPISTFFKASDLQVELTNDPKPKPEVGQLQFGKHFTDHMLTVEWDRERGWGRPHIKPFQNLSLHPASSALHYAVELFEGMKAFRGQDQRVRLFRPLMNMERMYRSAARASLPPFDQLQLLDCIRRLVTLDQDWVPHSDSASLYIRPTFIGTEPSLGVSCPGHALLFVILSPVGAYFATSPMGAVGLLAEPRYVRAWLGGVGDYKMGGNYAPTILVQDEAVRAGCQQALWLYGDDHQITEVGTMNIFLFWTDPQGDLELVTPPLNGIILPGVTRQSLLDLGRKWGEFKVSERSITMADLIRGLQEKRVREMFGSGTACVVSPVSHILYQGKTYPIPTMENGPELAKRFRKELTDIQYGRVPSDWVLPV
ncbi:branched-chain-amino-acid aminotransferase, mitochondrial [Dermochelys coriacea]|uniref:branched-chain-amino-acid aminotransferase, mitochondrial n=1 Tax=Dermochelys coriacea TaxID=27794 RepID=UPI0018E88EEE|nr:branched-chain-amino-acid aminotransferase, mitochondrial [Dermochelys coriacea]